MTYFSCGSLGSHVPILILYPSRTSKKVLSGKLKNNTGKNAKKNHRREDLSSGLNFIFIIKLVLVRKSESSFLWDPPTREQKASLNSGNAVKHLTFLLSLQSWWSTSYHAHLFYFKFITVSVHFHLSDVPHKLWTFSLILYYMLVTRCMFFLDLLHLNLTEKYGLLLST